MAETKKTFLDNFPSHLYRYIDGAGNGRPPISSNEKREDLNIQGYDAYFTINGFAGQNAQKENCICINAFFVDIDGRKDEKELEEIKSKLPPTYITETKNGYHIYWVLKDPIWKAKTKDWEDQIAKWERIEQALVLALKADPVVKDLTRILRQPDTFYWKKTGEAYKNGTAGVFKIKGIHKDLNSVYTMEQVANVFPPAEEEFNIDYPATVEGNKTKRFADNERKNFFDKVNEKFPIEERDSFRRLISGDPDTLPPTLVSRNQALLITATLMRQAGWSKKKALDHIKEVGWHGIEKEPGGWREISSTINSAFNSNYTYSYKNEVISYNMSPEEQLKIQDAYTAVAKARKETDKIRFQNYEREILVRYPYLKKNEIGIIFNYDNGVYKMMTDIEVEEIILNGLYEDMLWNFRTNSHIRDKLSCLLSIIPLLVITPDKGNIINLKNGLLNVATKEFLPHTPDFVSLIQYNVDYDPNAECPVWNRCMDAWTAGPEQEEKKLLLQQFMGYILTSSMYYDKALFLVGDGGNGKSTFVDTIGRIIGSNAVAHIDLESLYGQYGMKGLIGKRMNIIEEVHGNYYQSNKLKKLISGEEITIDIKYKDQFTFRPQCKFVFAVNQMPRVDDTSTATERRICVVLFNNNFRDNPDTTLRSELGSLFQERSGILNWMIEGLYKLREMGKFIITKEQMKTLSEYRQENSSVEGFIEECLEFGDNYSSPARLLYDEYKKYCTLDGRKFKANMVFTKEMLAYGRKNGVFTWKDRENGHEAGSFVGVRLAKSWRNASGLVPNYYGNT